MHVRPHSKQKHTYIITETTRIRTYAGCHSWRQSSKACSGTSHWSSRRSWGHSSLGWSMWGPRSSCHTRRYHCCTWNMIQNTHDMYAAAQPQPHPRLAGLQKQHGWLDFSGDTVWCRAMSSMLNPPAQTSTKHSPTVHPATHPAFPPPPRPTYSCRYTRTHTIQQKSRQKCQEPTHTSSPRGVGAAVLWDGAVGAGEAGVAHALAIGAPGERRVHKASSIRLTTVKPGTTDTTATAGRLAGWQSLTQRSWGRSSSGSCSWGP